MRICHLLIESVASFQMKIKLIWTPPLGIKTELYISSLSFSFVSCKNIHSLITKWILLFVLF